MKIGFYPKFDIGDVVRFKQGDGPSECTRYDKIREIILSSQIPDEWEASYIMCHLPGYPVPEENISTKYEEFSE